MNCLTMDMVNILIIETILVTFNAFYVERNSSCTIFTWFVFWYILFLFHTYVNIIMERYLFASSCINVCKTVIDSFV